jgi:hypothetical protein
MEAKEAQVGSVRRVYVLFALRQLDPFQPELVQALYQRLELAQVTRFPEI